MADIDFGQLSEALNEKADRDLINITDVCDVVIDTWSDGINWYRKYKSGWVEQGGFFSYPASTSNPSTINLPVEMADANYLVLRTTSFTNNGNSYASYNSGDWGKTPTSFKLYTEASSWGPGCSWLVMGFSAT